MGCGSVELLIDLHIVDVDCGECISSGCATCDRSGTAERSTGLVCDLLAAGETELPCSLVQAVHRGVETSRILVLDDLQQNHVLVVYIEVSISRE